MQAQLTVTFGTGTSATSTGGAAGAPMSYGGAYSWCQQIYRAAEFTAAGVPSGAIITSISFFNATGATTMSDIRTYLGHCTNDYFASTTSWVPYNTLMLVDSGDWVTTDTGWFEIQLDQPFVWDGTSNVVVGVSFRGVHSDYNTNNPNCGYRYTVQSDGSHIRRYSTTLSSCDPTSTAAANSTSPNRPNLRISYVIVGCSSSLAPTVANIGSYTADLNWINFQQSISSWDIMYGEEGTFDTLSGGTTITGITDTFYTLSGLTSATTYAVYMKSYCPSEIGPWSLPRIFTTTAACSAPTNLTITSFTADEATVSWLPGSNETGWEVACVPHGTPVGSAIPDYVYNSPYTFYNLNANTEYDIYVRADCGGGEYSYWSQISMTTACADLTTLPFIENFDSYAGSTATSVATSNLPNCWNHINSGTSTSYSGYPIIYNNTTYAASGTNSLRFYTYTTAGTYDDQIAVLPPVDENLYPINTLQISFDVRALSTSYTFKLDVGILTDPTNDNTFVTIQTLNISSTSFANYEIDFSQYLGTGKYIALRASQPTSGYNYGYVDNIRVEPIPACPRPINVTSSNVTTNSVTLSWTEVGTATSWEISYGPSGFIPGSASGMTEIVYSLPYTVTGLSASTLYDFYVKSDCGNGDYSNYSSAHSVSTQCDFVTVLPLMENFDSHAGSTSTSVSVNNLPNCWANHNTGTSTTYSGYPIIYNSSTYAASGTNAMRFYTYSPANTYSDQTAILPPIDVTLYPMNTLQISFDARDNSTSYPFNLQIGVMTDPTNINTFTPVSTITTQATTYANYEIPFNQYTGTGAFIAIRAQQPVSGYNYGYVDNIRVELIPACPKPYNVHATTVTNNTIELGWTEAGTATSWVVEYGPAGFTPGNGTVDYASTNPHTIYNLSASTTYDFYVKSDCGGTYSNNSTKLSVTTSCDAVTQLPFTDNFDTYGTGESAYPNCWGKINTYSSNRPYVNSTNYAGTGSLYFYSGSGTYNIAVTPPFDATIPVNTLQANFMYRASSTTDYMIVGVMSNPMDANTFVPIDTIAPIGSATAWTEREVVFAGYTGTGQYIAFYNGKPSTTCYSYIDNLSIDLIPSCPKPQDVHATSLTTNSIDLAWTEYGTATSWVVEYGPAGFTPGNGTTDNAYTIPHTISGLTASTTYDFYIKSDCGGTYSNNSTVFTIATSCDAVTQLPYMENFDTYGTGESAYPNCWGKINTYSSNRPYVNSTNYAGTGSLYFYSGSGTYNIAVTPPFDATIPVNTLQANFMYRASSTTDYMIVGVMSNPADASTFVPIDTIAPTGTASTWTEREVVFAGYTGNGQYIAFYNGKSSTTCYSYIDNLSINLIPSCPKPQDVHATNVSTTSIELAWTEYGTATSWVIEYGPTGFTPGTGTTENAYTNPYTISGLTASTTYDFYVKSDCGGGEFSNFSSVFTVATSCDAITQLPFIEGFDNYGTGTATAYPPCWTKYSTYTASTALPYCSSTHYAGVGSLYLYVATSGTYNMAITPPFDATIPINTLQATFMHRATNATDRTVVGVMSNPTDPTTFVPVDTIYPASTASTWTEREVVFSNYTGTGQYIVFRNEYTTSNCYTYVDNLVIDLIPACPKPQNVHATNVTTNSIELGWTEVGTATSWEIEYGPAGFTLGTGTTDNAYTNPHTISGLTASTQYDFYVKSDCGGGEYSSYSSVTTVATACDAITQLPYMENFDTYGTGESAYPNCWGKINTYSSNRPYVNSTHYAGVGSLYFYAGSASTYNIAVTPPFDASIPINTLQATFMHRAQYATDRLIVGVMSNPADASTFVPVDTILPASSPTAWQEVEVVFSQYTGTGQYIAFKNEYTSTYCYAYVDNLSIDLIPACPKPQSVHVTSATTNSIELGWTEVGTANAWVIEYGPAGFTPGNGTTENASTNPYTISGLTASTQYDFYVKSDCSGGEYSNYSSVLTASTACDAIDQLPYTENFDTYGTGESAYPNCWGKINTYSSNRPYVNATHYAGVGSLYFYAGTSGTYNIAVTPPFDASIPVNTLQATFMYRTTYATDRLVVGVMTNPADASSFVPVDTVYPDASYTTWVEREVVFSQYTGTGQYIAFKNEYTSTYCYAYIDNLSINLIPNCPKPHNLHVVDATTNSIELGWTEVGSATSWEIVYGAPGFDPDGSSATSVTATTNPYTVTGLNSSSTYDFYVRSNCSGAETSYWSNVLHASTTMTPESLPYTADFSANDAWVLNNGSCTNYWMKGTVGGTAALFVTDNGSTPNYTITSTSVVAAQKLFTVGTSDTITITFDVQVQGESSFDYMKLFLAPASQQFPASTSAPVTGQYGYNTYSTNAYNFYAHNYGGESSSYPHILNQVSGTLHVVAKMPNPNTNPNANSTALMVFAWKNDPSVGTQPPATITNLTVTASSVGPVTCAAPTGVTASNVTQTSATVTWTAGGTETAWELQYKTAAASNWSNSINVTGTPSHNLTGLTAGTQYQVRVRAVCSATETSNWSTTASFTTTQASVTPPTVTTLDADNISFSSALLHGTVAAGSETITAQGFEWKTTAGGTYTPVNATGTTMSYNLAGLAPTTGYTFRAFATTASGTTYGAEKTFTTLEEVQTCPAPTNVHTLDVTATSATITWTQESGTAISWDVQYRVAGATSWYSQTVQMNTATIAGLTSATTYEVNVIAHCSSDLSSEPSAIITLTTTGINDYTLDNTVTVYPNPTTGMIQIQNSESRIENVEVYDAYGKMLNVVNVNDNTTAVDLSNYAAGTYFVKIVTENGVVTKRVVKQ